MASFLRKTFFLTFLGQLFPLSKVSVHSVFCIYSSVAVL